MIFLVTTPINLPSLFNAMKKLACAYLNALIDVRNYFLPFSWV